MAIIKYKGGNFSSFGFTEAKADLYLADVEARKHRTQKEFGKGLVEIEKEKDKLKKKTETEKNK